MLYTRRPVSPKNLETTLGGITFKPGSHWTGVSHWHFVQKMQEVANDFGWDLLSEGICHVTRGHGINMAAIFPLPIELPWWTWAKPHLGIIHSINGDHAARVYLGVRFTDDESGACFMEYYLGKHTIRLQRDIDKRLKKLYDLIQHDARHLHERVIQPLMNQQISLMEREAVLTCLGRRGLSSWSGIKTVDDRLNELGTINGWTFTRAYGRAAKKRSPLTQMKKHLQFYHLMKEWL